MTVIGEIAAERKRQVEVEGWTLEHDDTHSRHELVTAAIEYATIAASSDRVRRTFTPGWPRSTWPWMPQWWRPKDRRRDLIRAAALIVAEIERLDRAAAATAGATERGGVGDE